MLTQEEKGLHWQALVFYAMLLDKVGCIIAGGAARDILMGNEPKDYDIWLFEDVSEKQVIDAVQEAYYAYYKQYGGCKVRVTDVCSDEYPSDNGEGEVTGIDFCIKVNFNGILIDIIKLVREEGKDIGIHDIFNSFDFPCNQFALLADSRVVGIGHLNTKQVAQRKLCINRLVKLRSKLPDFEFISLH